MVQLSSTSLDQLKFYNGLLHRIDKKRMTEFEQKSLIDRFFSGQEVFTEDVIEELGPTAVHFSNVQPWADEIPDIDTRSARTFSLWAEDLTTNEVVVTIRGFYVLIPLHWSKDTIQDYYFVSENIPYFPMAIIPSFMTIINQGDLLNDLIECVKKEIQKNWRELRQRIINTLKKTDLWKRYVLSFEKIIHFTFLCPSFDRMLVKALQKHNYRFTGGLQMLASPTHSYDEAIILSHLNGAKKIIETASSER
jgi:hypothetical protein